MSGEQAGADGGKSGGEGPAGDARPLGEVRQFVALPRDVLVLSLAMLAFSLAFQMTSRFVPEYMRLLGAGPIAVGVFKSLSDLISAVYPYPGGAVSDAIGSRYALTVFGIVSTVGFGLWLLAPDLGVAIGPVVVPALAWILLVLFLMQALKSLGLGATFAVVKQSVAPEHLAAGFASTETFRRVGFLLAPVIATGVLVLTAGFVWGFQVMLLIAIVAGLVATILQYVFFEPEEGGLGASFEGFATIRRDLRGLPDPLEPLLLGDALVRFGNGMVYALVIWVITDVQQVGATILGIGFTPAAFFGVLLAVEMVVALATMIPVARLAELTGLKPVVALGFVVYAVFPLLLVLAPPDPLVIGVVFAFSGLRFAGLPAHKALIVGPAEAGGGGRVTGTYYLVRNVIVIPSGIVGGALYGVSPTLAFGLATVVGLVGTALFLLFGEEFAAYQ
ncbi:MAG: MFS transporter [Haloarculaceae archaeon]